MGQTITTPPGLITPSEASEMTQIPQKQLWEWAREGRVVKVEHNGTDYFTEASVYAIAQPTSPSQAESAFEQRVTRSLGSEGHARHLMDLHREVQRYFDIGARYFILGMQAVQELALLELTGQPQQPRGAASELFAGAARGGLVRPY